MLIVVSPAKALDYESPLPTKKFSVPTMLDESRELVSVMTRQSPDDLARCIPVGGDRIRPRREKPGRNGEHQQGKYGQRTRDNQLGGHRRVRKAEYSLRFMRHPGKHHAGKRKQDHCLYKQARHSTDSDLFTDNAVHREGDTKNHRQPGKRSSREGQYRHAGGRQHDSDKLHAG